MRIRLLSRADNTKVITFIYFFLLLYTIAILLWWGILLKEQGDRITRLEQQNLELRLQQGLSRQAYQWEAQSIQKEKRLHNLQYIGEGSTFLLIILLSAGFVYQAMRRQIRFGRQQQNFMAAVTHELKSPIAVTRLNIETLKKHHLSDEKKDKLLDNTLRELSRLNQLCNNMLLASQFDSRQYHMVKEETDLSALLQQTVEETAQRLPYHPLTLEAEKGIRVMADGFMLQIAINNLLDNASKYAPRNTSIRVRLFAADHRARLQVADEGEGVPAWEREKIFSRFYRSGNENTRQSKGTGLGLFLARKIIAQHHGEIRVSSNRPKGSIFEIILPEIAPKTPVR
jgi:signal transduction histidine kinase